jgi:hypothetical protein
MNEAQIHIRKMGNLWVPRVLLEKVEKSSENILDLLFFGILTWIFLGTTGVGVHYDGVIKICWELQRPSQLSSHAITAAIIFFY